MMALGRNRWKFIILMIADNDHSQKQAQFSKQARTANTSIKLSIAGINQKMNIRHFDLITF
jgi:hypothetical protein